MKHKQFMNFFCGSGTYVTVAQHNESLRRFKTLLFCHTAQRLSHCEQIATHALGAKSISLRATTPRVFLSPSRHLRIF
jgi:hypothetical protein